jgi:hypothetical protein
MSSLQVVEMSVPATRGINQRLRDAGASHYLNVQNGNLQIFFN